MHSITHGESSQTTHSASLQEEMSMESGNPKEVLTQLRDELEDVKRKVAYRFDHVEHVVDGHCKRIKALEERAVDEDAEHDDDYVYVPTLDQMSDEDMETYANLEIPEYDQIHDQCRPPKKRRIIYDDDQVIEPKSTGPAEEPSM